MVPVHSPLVSLGRYKGFLLGRAVGVQALVCTVAQTWVHGPSLVGRVEHFVKALVDHKGQALTTELGVAAERGPATSHVLRIGFFEAVGCFDFVRVAVELATLGVARDVDGEHHLGGKFATFFEHRIDGVGVGLGMLGQGLEFGAHVEQLVQHKLHVTKGWVVDGHERTP